MHTKRLYSNIAPFLQILADVFVNFLLEIIKASKYLNNVTYLYLCLYLLKAGLEIVTTTVAFATKVFPFATKISGEVAN